MKKITVFICAAALACSMSFPAFAAQTKLNQCLEQKKKALSSMEQINGIWAQIDSLLK